MKGSSAVAAFCRAVWKHDERTLAALGEKVDPNGADRWGQTPLRMAAQYGDLETVQLLVRRGAEVEQGRIHLTPLTYAARRGAADMVQFLRRKGARPSPVTWVYLGDRTQLARALSADPALANLRDEDGTPLIFHAAMALQPAIIELLIDHGASATATAPDGGTPLHGVSDLRRASPSAGATAALLLDHGADPNARNWADVTPLHQAVRARNLSVVEVLLARGADPNARDNRGSTPLRRAVSPTGASATAGTTDLMVPLTRMLLAAGADPDAKDKRGIAVHASARRPDVRAVLAEYRGKKKKTGAKQPAKHRPRPPR
jgi:ankyrin repeat protein